METDAVEQSPYITRRGHGTLFHPCLEPRISEAQSKCPKSVTRREDGDGEMNFASKWSLAPVSATVPAK